MGHLINPISLQIKYQGSWKLSWNQYLRKDFAYFFFFRSIHKRRCRFNYVFEKFF